MDQDADTVDMNANKDLTYKTSQLHIINYSNYTCKQNRKCHHKQGWKPKGASIRTEGRIIKTATESNQLPSINAHSCVGCCQWVLVNTQQIGLNR